MTILWARRCHTGIPWLELLPRSLAWARLSLSFSFCPFQTHALSFTLPFFFPLARSLPVSALVGCCKFMTKLDIACRIYQTTRACRLWATWPTSMRTQLRTHVQVPPPETMQQPCYLPHTPLQHILRLVEKMPRCAMPQTLKDTAKTRNTLSSSPLS